MPRIGRTIDLAWLQDTTRISVQAVIEFHVMKERPIGLAHRMAWHKMRHLPFSLLFCLAREILNKREDIDWTIISIDSRPPGLLSWEATRISVQCTRIATLLEESLPGIRPPLPMSAAYHRLAYPFVCFSIVECNYQVQLSSASQVIHLKISLCSCVYISWWCYRTRSLDCSVYIQCKDIGLRAIGLFQGLRLDYPTLRTATWSAFAFQCT